MFSLIPFFLFPLFASAAQSPVERKRSLPSRSEFTPNIVARGLPSGWSAYVASGNDGGACYTDGMPRILPDWNTRLTYSSIEIGLKTCRDLGYTWAGLQDYTEVYCSNKPPTRIQNAPASQCASKCSSGEICGGSWHNTVYTYTDPSTVQWTSLGCYQDVSARIVQGYSYWDGELTTAKCQTTCASKGYSLAGVEYGTECYCGNTNTGQKLSDQSCSMTCGGGGSNCGYAWAMSLYQVKSATSVVTTPAAPTWNYLFCATDSWERALVSTQTYMGDLTTAKCQSYCTTKGFVLAGTEASGECFCANTLTLSSSGAGKQVSDSECSSVCYGDSGAKCGGSWRISLYSTLTGSALSSALGRPATTTTTTTTTTSIPTTAATTTTTAMATTPTTTRTTTTTATAVPTTTTTTPVPQASSYTIATDFPSGGNGNKLVYAHFILGNAYPYTPAMWRTDISRAQGAGIDGFMLNLGGDYWQPARVADAYAAAAEKGFKMVLSFDMTEFDCGSWNRVPLFQTYLRDYVGHAAAGKYNGRSILTTFAGESCSFGQGSTNNGWNAVLGQWRSQIHFAPAYHVDPMSLGGYQLDTECSWGSAWPVEGKEIETSRDLWFMQNLGGRGYMGTVSPLFYAGIPGKNYIWRGDNFLFGARWDQLLSMRDKTDIVQVVSWNDYGESHYLNEIVGDWPQSVKDAGYISNDFSHTALLSLQAFYSAAWKNGAYPAITKDQIWAMARPHQAWAGANGEPPQRRSTTNDNLYIQVHLLAPADVILCSGSCTTQRGQAGKNRFSQPLQVGQTASVRVERNGQVTARVDGKITFSSNPQKYNFNYWILSSS